MTTTAALKEQILGLLARGRRPARFVSELRHQLGAPTDLDAALAELEHAGQVLVREQFCGDPHLEGTDLRIVALVQPGADGQDGISHAIDAIDTTWQRWLAEYLANHRCS